MNASSDGSADGIEVVPLSTESLEQASALLAEYVHPDGYDEEQRRHCYSALERLLEFPSAQFVLARRADSFVGFAALAWYFSTTKGAPVLYVHDLFTRPKHRRTGVGRALLEYAADLARARGANRVQLNTDQDNRAARELYSAFGFTIIPGKQVYILLL